MDVSEIISEEIMFDLFKEIIKDSTNVFTIHYKNAYVSGKTFQNTVLPLNTENGIQYKSKVQLISDYYFNMNDTLFISNQIKKDTFDIYKLSDIGYKTFDWSKLDDSVSRALVPQDSLDKISELIKNNNYISISNPIFNKSMNQAYIEIDYETYRGISILYKKKNNVWAFDKRVGNWIR